MAFLENLSSNLSQSLYGGVASSTDSSAPLCPPSPGYGFDSFLMRQRSLHRHP